MKSFFRKPKSYHESAAKKAEQEHYIRQYFDDVNLSKPADATAEEFDNKKVFARITNQIEQTNAQALASKKKWIAAAGIIGFLLASTFAFYILRFQTPIKNKELLTANGQISKVTLADGTEVWLNSGSKLQYPEEFRGDKREVLLQGEAFFNVKHDAQHPFIVHSGNITTQVLGTSFNVKAYAKDPIMKVDVLTGKVGVINHNHALSKTVFLTANQEAVYDTKSAQLYKDELGYGAILSSWKDGKLVFKNQLLPEVLNALQRRFSIHITADDNLHSCRISADFTEVSLPDILTILSRLVKGKITQSQVAYQLHGKGC